ncbi:hypothetical protein [Cryptosporangium aurantiacum]|uniref:Uncharacterized protein n=1 Tax=Cryptosporangium aurantiacum TaxID=134849 RepID=A0A1M7RKC6_9ACTN|nr:hypothetical protein [Cryptosporangium aurantiacum]SHN46612.1 hypothetical protein SAMN05443668_116148 [Cryptosporangium aurantiacum]
MTVAEGGRRLPIPQAGVLRPLWDIGLRTSAGHPDLRVARIWVENARGLLPGGRGRIRLAPLSPSEWHALRPGQRLAMHEGTPPVGVATIIQISAFTE